jgi:uncharacterized membrane protein YhhN
MNTIQLLIGIGLVAYWIIVPTALFLISVWVSEHAPHRRWWWSAGLILILGANWLLWGPGRLILAIFLLEVIVGSSIVGLVRARKPQK